MCSTHLDEESSLMDTYRGQGDLVDILMPRNRVSPNDDFHCAATSPEDHLAVDWRFPPQHDDCLPNGDGIHGYDFGDPFYNMKNPLLHKLALMSPNGSSLFGRSISEDSSIYPVEEKVGVSFSAVPFGSLENPIAYSEAINSNSRLRLVDTSTAIQISAVQNSSMKRRKGQAKKVVCIPAPAAANGQAGGEVVPLDLWAWRKYGQKPIKGSPYPRGYYRCSSSKGCSARTQVERSRTDPNVLVITYTSEHNHPWPTQRNTLAGSTRATQSANKNNTCNNAVPKISSPSSSPSKNQQRGDKRPNDVVSPGEAAAGGSSSAYIKEEMAVTTSETLEEAGMTGLFSGKCDDEFLFQDMEAVDGGGDPLSFLLNQGAKQKSIAADSDSFGNFFDWSD